MGEKVGILEGLSDEEEGSSVACKEGLCDVEYELGRCEYCLFDGLKECVTEGICEGNLDGCLEGLKECVSEGISEGTLEGCLEGILECSTDGKTDGTELGVSVSRNRT
mmetsp:Transcript_42413/g.50890  ORF Transcript_42413/g.50890 Transcript_42413/m.50890 type:complete len:108 (-) Transcript_42413:85-408(-)